MSGAGPPHGSNGYTLLARELRRLRGSRSLREMEALSRRPPHCRTSEPLSSSALNAWENARQRPSVATLLSLASLYGCPSRVLLLWIRLEPYRARIPEGGDPASCATAVEESLGSGEYARAIPRAIRERELATGNAGRAGAELRLAMALEGEGLGEEAMTLLGETLRNPDLTPAQRIGALHGLVRLHMRAGCPDAAEGAALRAIAVAEESGERAGGIESRARLVDVLLRRAEGRHGRVALDRAGRAQAEAEDLATGRGEGRWRTVLRYLRGRLLLAEGREEEARALLEDTFPLMARDTDPSLAASAAIHLGWARWRCGDPPGARSAFRDALRLGRRAALPEVEREAREILASIDGARGVVRAGPDRGYETLRLFISGMDTPSKRALGGRRTGRG